jgi:hypothetical protein
MLKKNTCVLKKVNFYKYVCMLEYILEDMPINLLKINIQKINLIFNKLNITKKKSSNPLILFTNNELNEINKSGVIDYNSNEVDYNSDDENFEHLIIDKNDEFANSLKNSGLFCIG